MGELQQYLSTLRRWLWLIVLATIMAGAVGLWTDLQSPRLYRSTATLSAGRPTERIDPQAADFTISQQLAQSYTQLVRRRPFQLAVRNSLDPELQAGGVQLNATVTSNLIEISALDPNPQRAQGLADGAARQLILESPTPAEEETEQNREFVVRQLASLQARIDDGEAQLRDLDAQLARETSARATQELQNQIAALHQKMNTWETNYTRLLDFSRGGRNTLSLVEPASAPILIGSPGPPTVLVSAALGFLLAAGAALLLDYFDDKVRTADTASKGLGLPVLGAIPRVASGAAEVPALAAWQAPNSLASEAYRLLFTSLQSAGTSEPLHNLLVVSAGPNEGKTSTATNLAITIAQTGQRVILCDADLRRPSVHKVFGLAGPIGLSSLLLDQQLSVDDALIDSPVPGLKVLPSGPCPASPGGLLGSRSMKERLEQLNQAADVVVIDSPAALAVADPAILAALTGKVILVVASGRVSYGHVQRARTVLEQVGAKVLGIVVNGVPESGNPAYEYYVAEQRPVEDEGRPNGRLFGRHKLNGLTSLLRGRRPAVQSADPDRLD